MSNEIETKIYLEQEGFTEYEIEEIIEDYLPEVKKHIGFCDNRSDSRFVVKFHDICYFTHTPEDMSDDEFNNLFDIFCNEQYNCVKECMDKETYLVESSIFATHDVGHYRAFEYIQTEPITEDNVLQVAINLYNEGLSPFYIHDYTLLVGELQNMEDNYMEWWLEFLRGYVGEEFVNITDETIKNIERRYEDYKKTHDIK